MGFGGILCEPVLPDSIRVSAGPLIDGFIILYHAKEVKWNVWKIFLFFLCSMHKSCAFQAMARAPAEKACALIKNPAAYQSSGIFLRSGLCLGPGCLTVKDGHSRVLIGIQDQVSKIQSQRGQNAPA